MNIIKKLWSGLSKLFPDQAKQVLQDEIEALTKKQKLFEEELVKIDKILIYVAIDKLVKELRDKRNEPYTEAEEQFLRTFFTAKKNCHHLKGASMVRLGNLGRWMLDKYSLSKGPFKDYNVSDHIFPDGTRVIKCLTGCGKKWTKDSPDWSEALKMVESSSNFRSASEVVYSALARKQ
jgi:hypothetical protein